jgi:tetratricopeptide (TPR) repeat protein
MKKYLLALAFAATSLSASAQEEMSLGELVDNGLKAMNAGDWQKALEFNSLAAAKSNGNPKMAIQLYGQKFGVIVYRKGISEIKLNMFTEAMATFESCYKDYPGEGNMFNKMALLKWGEAAMGAGDYELAIAQWMKFLEERDKARDKYPQGAFHINMAICHYRIGKPAEGNEHLEIAITNKASFPTPDAAIISGFQAMVTSSIEAKNEQVILDFIAKNRGALIIAPYAMQRFSKIFMKLAGDAVGAGMTDTALQLYQFVPSTQAAIDDLRSRINAMGNLARISDRGSSLDKAKLEEELKALEAEQRSNKSVEMIKLSATAFIHEINKSFYGAYGAYMQLEQYYPKAEKREENLYHLVRLSSIIGLPSDTQKYGELHLKRFAGSKHTPDLQKLMLSSLFFDRKYELSIEIANDIIQNKKAQEGSPEHDLALFVLGGSYFYTGQYDKSSPILDEHVERYPKSLFAMTASYFQASNASRLQYWTKAASLLDAFLDKYKDESNQSYIPLALYDRANVHYYEEQNEPAIEKLDRIIKEFPDSPVTDQAYNLKGNVLQSLERKEDAEAAYLKTLEIAEARGNGGVAGEALYYLIVMLSEPQGNDPNPRLKEAIPFADKYWEKYATDSPYRAQVAVAQVKALQEAGRGDEALERLQEVIATIAKLTEAPGLEAAINSYTEVYLENHTPEELKEHYYNFPGVGNSDKAARALLRIAIIGVFEEVAKENKDDEAKQRDANAMIKVLFDNLKSDFGFKDLSTYILVKLGDYLRTNTSAPREAIPYYDEVLSRQDQEYRFAALTGRADIYGQSTGDADLDKAIEDFGLIFKDSENKAEREFALYRMIQILMKKGDYANAAERANEYLNRDEGKSLGFSKYTPEVGFMLARTFEQRKMNDDAISMYVKVWSAHMGYIKVSAPAVEAWMKLSYQRNRKSDDPKVQSDRQGAYAGGYRYLELTGRFKDKMTPEELALWENVQKLTDQYAADPAVKTMEQLKKEEEENR